MASPEVRICNRALARIGQTTQITSLEQANVAARQCKLIFDDAVRETLEAHDWPFARRRATLGEIDDGARGDWSFAYTLPDDFIAARFIQPGTVTDVDVDEESPAVDPTGLLTGARAIPFDLEDDERLGTILLTDQEDAELAYTAYVDKAPRWSPNFIKALTLCLAADLALSVAKRPTLAEALDRKFELYIKRAAHLVSKHRKPRARPPSIFERNR